MKTLYYCMGGGLGHITRFAAFCRHFAIRPALLTNCEQVRSGRIKIAAEPVMMPDDADMVDRESFKEWIENILKSLCPAQLVIDSFPGGILGELCAVEQLQNINCVYLARILDLSAYQRRLTGKLPGFSRIYRLEKLGEEQERWLHGLNAPVEDVSLPYACSDNADLLDKAGHLRLPPNCWLIIHSGNREELKEIWDFARQTADIERATPAFAMVSPGPRPDFLPPESAHFDVYPADSLLKQAKRVFSAAGYNIMQQMRFYKAEHRVLPMSRAIDDQFLRYQLHQRA